MTHHVQKTIIQITADLSETMKLRREQDDIVKLVEGKTLVNQEFYIQQNYASIIKSK